MTKKKISALAIAAAEKHTFNVTVQHTGVLARGAGNAWDSLGAADGIAK